MLDRMFTGSTEVMTKAMDALSLRQRAIAENIANADTPNYKRVEVSYEAQLHEAATGASGPSLQLRTTMPGQIRIGGPQSLEEFQAQVTRITGTTMRNDGNNVDPEAEMAHLAQTNVTYDALADLMKRRMTLLHSIIRGN